MTTFTNARKGIGLLALVLFGGALVTDAGLPAQAERCTDDICIWARTVDEIAVRDGIDKATADLNLQRLLGLAPVQVHVPAPEIVAAPARYVHRNPLIELWYDTAIQAGFTDAEWRWVSCVMNRETGQTGNPAAYNGRDPSKGSRGLMQINGIWLGPLREVGIITQLDDLFDPATNLRAARYIFERSGKSPWKAKRSSC